MLTCALIVSGMRAEPNPVPATGETLKAEMSLLNARLKAASLPALEIKNP
jgi:hypothetical protein